MPVPRRILVDMPDNPRDSWPTHGPIVWATGGQSYGHLGRMMTAPPQVLAAHLTDVHHTTPADGTLSAVTNAERHAYAHGVRLGPLSIGDTHVPD